MTNLKTSIQSRENYQRLYLLGLAVVFFGIVLWVRLRLLGLPLERDEGEYAYMAHMYFYLNRYIFSIASKNNLKKIYSR